MGGRVPSGLHAVLLDKRTLILRFIRARGVADAEDLLHEVWIRVGSVDAPVADPLGYIMRTANNLIIDRQRSETQRAVRERLWGEQAPTGTPTAIEVTSSERILLAREELEQVRRTIAELGSKTEAIFYRYRTEGMSRRQIADELGITVSAVEKHLQKAYRRLLELRRQGA